MEAYVLDRDFNAVAILDTFESFIWTDRFDSVGDFEIYLPMDSKWLQILKKNYYLWRPESEHMMIIEQTLVESDVDDGNHLTVTGRSLESILDRRVIWGQYIFNGTLQNAIQKILEDSFINPVDADRKIANFIFTPSTDERITSLKIDTQYTGDNVYDVIQKLCSTNHIGFKVTLNANNQFEFQLYAGTDRSYAQTVNPYVIFSPEFDNIVNSSYLENTQPLKNVTFIAGEGEGADRKTTSVGSGSGLDRRELYTDARDLSSTVNEGTLTDEQYLAKLQQRGTEKLSECKEQTAFEGEAETTRMFRYGEDFVMGDIVQVANEYGHEGRVYVSELIFSHNSEGFSVYPTFKLVKEEGV